MRLNIILLLDVLFANRCTLREVDQKDARVKLVCWLIERHPSVRPCFGSDHNIERHGGSKETLRDILRVLETRYDELRALEIKDDVSPAHLREVKDNFAGSSNYVAARRKADEIFSDRSLGTTTASRDMSQGVNADGSIVARFAPAESSRACHSNL